jgi:ribosomal protein S3
MYAHYFTGKGQKFVIISETARPVGIRILVSGKVEARKIAKDRNAKPWNF